MTTTRLFATKPRFWTHLFLALFALIGCYLTIWLTPDFPLARQLTIGLGYAALILLVLTLLIGPWKLRDQPRNPVNINLRRDIGIWTAITGLLHVLFGFQIHLDGQIWRYFFGPEGGLLLDPFGVSNYLGAVATIILALLLLLSNDVTLRRLKGRRWKNFQRFNYGLFVLVVAHTLGYQLVVERDAWLILVAVGLALLTGLAQGWGIFQYRATQGQQTAWRRPFLWSAGLLAVLFIIFSLLFVAGSRQATEVANYRTDLLQVSDELAALNASFQSTLEAGGPLDPATLQGVEAELATLETELEALGPAPDELSAAHTALKAAIGQFRQAQAHLAAHVAEGSPSPIDADFLALAVQGSDKLEQARQALGEAPCTGFQRLRPACWLPS